MSTPAAPAVKLLQRTLLDELAHQARASPRGRAHHNIHLAASELVQRFFVVADRASYFRPHRHSAKSELALVLRGGFDVLTFDAQGILTARYAVGEDQPAMAFEMPRATWHTLIARCDASAFLEVKEGPYDPASASEFASWAPAEGAPEAPQFLERLRTLTVGTSG